MSVTVYVKRDCKACDLTKKHLDKRGVAFEEKHIDEVFHAAKARGITAAPVVQVGLEMFGGYRPDKLDQIAATGTFISGE